MRPALHATMHCALPLSVGGATYLLFRSRSTHGVAALDGVGLGAALDGLREVAAPVGALLPEAIVFTLPDALWAYALVWALVSLHAERRLRLAWLAVAVALGAGLELGQLAGVVGGTFDPLDLGLSLAATALGWCVAERSRLSFGGA